MTDPFAVLRVPVVVQATKALNATILNCWPRILEGGYEGEVMRTIATCWLNLHDGKLLDHRPISHDVGPLIQELTQTVKMLQSLRRTDATEPLPGLHEILKEEPKLEGLFFQSLA